MRKQSYGRAKPGQPRHASMPAGAEAPAPADRPAPPPSRGRGVAHVPWRRRGRRRPGPSHPTAHKKSTRAGTIPALAISFELIRLHLQEPDSELGTRRGPLPPELPAGKRGGWHRDSVYPRFRLTSFAHRAVNFGGEFTIHAM